MSAFATNGFDRVLAIPYRKKMKKIKFDTICALSGPERYKHFISVVANFEQAWGLWRDGWALGESGDGTPLFPLWPAAEFAQACSEGEWLGHLATAIPLADLLDDLLPRLQTDAMAVAVFQTPANRGVVFPADVLHRELTLEAEGYA
jgi:hypothetical protein